MPNIGPTFGDELNAAGLVGLPLSWSSDGEIYFSEAVTRAQRRAVLDVLAVHNPLVLSPRQVLLAQLETATTLSQLRTVVQQLFGA